MIAYFFRHDGSACRFAVDGDQIVLPRPQCRLLDQGSRSAADFLQLPGLADHSQGFRSELQPLETDCVAGQVDSNFNVT
jgi:hypothetical protein